MKSKSGKSGGTTKQARCYRCNDLGYLARDKKCTALNHTCVKCRFKGHLEKCCRTKKKKVRYISENNDSATNSVENSSEQVFTMSQHNKGKIDLNIDSVNVKNVIIVDGNVMDEKNMGDAETPRSQMLYTEKQ